MKNSILKLSAETLLLLGFIVAYFPLINDSILIQVIIKLEKIFYRRSKLGDYPIKVFVNIK